MTFVERFVVLCRYLGESTIRGPTVVGFVRMLYLNNISHDVIGTYVQYVGITS